MPVSIYHYNYDNPHSYWNILMLTLSLPVDFEVHLSKTLPWLQLQVKKMVVAIDKMDYANALLANTNLLTRKFKLKW